MNASSPITRLTDDLAAQWTDAVLEILKAVEIQPTIASEIEAWHTLIAILQGEFRSRRVDWLGGAVSMKVVLERVLRRTLLALTRDGNVWSTSRALDNRIRQSTTDWKPTAAEREAFGASVRRLARPPAYPAARATDFVPRFGYSAVHGPIMPEGNSLRNGAVRDAYARTSGDTRELAGSLT